MAGLALTTNLHFSRCTSLRPRPPHPTYKPIQCKLIDPKIILKPTATLIHHASNLLDPTAVVGDVLSEFVVRKIDAKGANSKSTDCVMIGLVVLICFKAIAIALAFALDPEKAEKKEPGEKKEPKGDTNTKEANRRCLENFLFM